MITHLQKTWKMQFHIVPYILEFFRQVRFLVRISILNSQKLIECIYREVEEYSRPENYHESIQHIKIYAVFTQQQNTNSTQVPIDYKLGDTEIYPET